MTRRGIGLLELVVALALTGAVASLAGGIVATATARLRDRSDRMAGEHALRVALGAVRAGLESLGQDSAAGADLLTMNAGGFIARVTRGAGVLCSADPTELVARRSPGWWAAVRDPIAGRDSLLVATLTVPGWLRLELRAAPRQAPCPDGSAGLALPTTLDAASLERIGPGSPFRFFEAVEMRDYRSGGAEWLGLRLVATGEAIQPLAGPLSRAGLKLAYFSSDGGVAVVPGDVTAASLRLNGITELRGTADSLAGFVALRNHR